jgi:hypothetical protein
MACLFLVGAAQASYAADRPLESVYTGDLRGGYLYSTGTSIYSSSLKPNDSCNASFSMTMPPNSTTTFGRLYVYWAWSKIRQDAVYPVFTVRDSRYPEQPLNLTSRYVDSKGFVSSYDFYSGTDAYDLSPLTPGQNNFTVTVTQDGLPDSTVLVFGMAALSVYTSPQESRRLIWVKEGCDLMYSSYGISPEMATSTITFPGSLPSVKIGQAELFLVAPSGGYSRDLQSDINRLAVNRLDEEKTPPLLRTIFSLLFPNYKGKEWNDIFSMDNATQIGFETKEIRPYLRNEDNHVTVRDQGDYFQLTNAVLMISLEGEADD